VEQTEHCAFAGWVLATASAKTNNTTISFNNFMLQIYQKINSKMVIR